MSLGSEPLLAKATQPSLVDELVTELGILPIETHPLAKGIAVTADGVGHQHDTAAAGEQEDDDLIERSAASGWVILDPFDLIPCATAERAPLAIPDFEAALIESQMASASVLDHSIQCRPAERNKKSAAGRNSCPHHSRRDIIDHAEGREQQIKHGSNEDR